MSLPSLTRFPSPTEEECNQPPLCPNCDAEVIDCNWGKDTTPFFFTFCLRCGIEVRATYKQPANKDIIGYHYFHTDAADSFEDEFHYHIDANRLHNKCTIIYRSGREVVLEYLLLKEAKIRAEKLMTLL